MRQSLNSKTNEQQHAAWAMGYVVTPNLRAERSEGKNEGSYDRGPLALKSSLADVREMLIANIDPIPSANNNLLLVRGLFNSVIKLVKTELAPRSKYAARVATQIWPRRLERQISLTSNPVSISLLVLFEGSIVWSLASLAGSVPVVASKTAATLVAGL